jgi:amino-acid N-acetyltransferase
VSVTLRAATSNDAAAIHDLVTSNLEAGHLLPRTLSDIQERAGRFFVADRAGIVVGCAELAPLSARVAEVRSLVVDEAMRGQKIGTRLVRHLASAGSVAGFTTLCAFTHDPSHFVRLGFTIVPHIWMPEKIEHDCTACSLFRQCGQYAVRLPLQRGVGAAPGPAATMVHRRAAAPSRRPTIERLTLTPVGKAPAAAAVVEQPEAVLA